MEFTLNSLPLWLGTIGPLRLSRNSPILGKAVTIEAVDRYCRQIHGPAVLLSSKKPPHRDLVALFHHVEDIDPGARHKLGSCAQHVSGTIMTGPKAADRRIMQLEVFREPLRDVINVSGRHRSRDPQEKILPR
jgi:hypothetical protein